MNKIISLLIFILLVNVSYSNEYFNIPRAIYPKVVDIIEYCKQDGIDISIFGGTVRDIVLGETIPPNDNYDLLLPGNFDRQNLTVKQRNQLKRIAKIAGGANKCNFIFSKNKESFMRLMSIGGFSISKVAIRYDGKVIDPYGGFQDLINRKLRYIRGKADYWPSFLKMYDILRAIRFVTQFPGMKLEDKTRDYFYKQMDLLLKDKDLQDKIRIALKQINKKDSGERKRSFDIIKAKVQVREIENRLRKAYQYSKNQAKTYEMLDEFAIIDFLKSVEWPEGGYVYSKLWKSYRSDKAIAMAHGTNAYNKPTITDDPYKTLARTNTIEFVEQELEEYSEEETVQQSSVTDPDQTEPETDEDFEQFEDFEFEFDEETGDFDFDFDFE